MSKIERERSDLESAVKPLVEAANTEHWKNALNVLYLNPSVLSFGKEFPVPVLVSLDGDDDEIEKSIDLLMGRAKTSITPLIGSFLNLILPRVLVVAKEQVQTAEGTRKDQMVAVLAALEIGSEMEKHKRRINEMLIQGAFSISDMIAAGAYQALMEKRNIHIESTLDDEEYEQMVEYLEKIGLVEPKVQISICPNCANYQFIVSPKPWVMEGCSKCGAEWATQTLYTFAASFDRLKADGSDLPLFVSAYLRHKTMSLAPFGEPAIYPMADLTTPSGEHVEVDVLLPEYQLGIECKAFEDCFAPLTDNRISSIVGRLIPQLKRYVSVGVSTVGVVTNLPSDATSKLASVVQGELLRQQIKAQVVFVEGTPEKLLKWLDELAEVISKNILKGLEQRLSEETKPTKVELKDSKQVSDVSPKESTGPQSPTAPG